MYMSIDQDSHLTFANKVVQRRAEFKEGRTWSSSDTSFRREIVVDKGSTIRSQISREKTGQALQKLGPLELH